jgi:hypothetical protein
MKKFTLLLLCLSLGIAAFAQEGLQIGFRFSPLISFATVIEDSNKDRLDIGQMPRMGYAYGLVGSFGFTDNYGLNSGVLITNRGFRAEAGDSTSTTRVTAVVIPFGFKLRSNEIGNGLYFRGIFNLDFEINVGYRQRITYNNGDEGRDNRDPKNINPFTTAFVFGGGFEKEYDFGTFDLGISFHRGLMNVNNKDNALQNTIVRLNYVSLDLGYFF